MVTVERSERHRERPSGPIRAERYPTVILARTHKKTIFALWALPTQRLAKPNHNFSPHLRTRPDKLHNNLL